MANFRFYDQALQKADCQSHHPKAYLCPLDDAYQAVTATWVILDMSVLPSGFIFATPFSVTNELLGVHTFYIKTSIASPNYSDAEIAPTYTQFTVEVIEVCDCEQVDWFDSLGSP